MMMIIISSNCGNHQSRNILLTHFLPGKMVDDQQLLQQRKKN